MFDFKQRVHNYFNYILNEQRKKTLFDLHSTKLRYSALTSKEMGTCKTQYYSDQTQVIVSLTTYGLRIFDVYLTIESLLNQTFPPNRILLWLSEEEKGNDLPELLLKQQRRGLEIMYYKDILSYKKLIPSLKLFPNDVIITVDDDVIYTVDALEFLIKSSKANPNCICANWCMRIKLNHTGIPKSYGLWDSIGITEKPSKLNFPIGCAGVLYPPHCLSDHVFDESTFMNICKFADDIWFKAMALMNGSNSIMTTHNAHEFMYYDNPLWQDMGLTPKNIKLDMNDTQFKAVLDNYNLYTKLAAE
mgnify:CR=1 FL=1